MQVLAAILRGRLLLGLFGCLLDDGRLLLSDELLQRGAHQRSPLQIAPRDHLAFRVQHQPALATSQQFLDLVLTEIVVLGCIKHRH
ncbi:MAG TPA: hypothetical protein VFU22_19420 [Roseiflexaceae bacterium]|nr:hypothetical protein [Roseiflexaceae bacterium]